MYNKRLNYNWHQTNLIICNKQKPIRPLFTLDTFDKICAHLIQLFNFKYLIWVAIEEYRPTYLVIVVIKSP